MNTEEKIKSKTSKIIWIVFVLVVSLPFLFIIGLFVFAPGTEIKNYNLIETFEILKKQINIRNDGIESLQLSQSLTFTFLGDSIMEVVVKLKPEETSRLVSEARGPTSKFERGNIPPRCAYKDKTIDDNSYVSCSEKHTLGCNLEDSNKSFYYFSNSKKNIVQGKEYSGGQTSIIIDETDNLLYFCDTNN